MGLREDGDRSGCSGGDTQEGAAGDGRVVGGHQEILQNLAKGEKTSLWLQALAEAGQRTRHRGNEGST
jgi:hypothetical protein